MSNRLTAILACIMVATFAVGFVLPVSVGVWRKMLCQSDRYGTCECPNQAMSCQVP